MGFFSRLFNSEKKALNKIEMFYRGYPEQPYISPQRDLDKSFEMLENFPTSRVKYENMVRNSDNLLNGHIVLLYWLSQDKNKNRINIDYPEYFEYRYGINAKIERDFLLSQHLISVDNTLTDRGNAILLQYSSVLTHHKDPDGIKQKYQNEIKENKNIFIPVLGDDGLNAEHQGIELYKIGEYDEAEKALLYAVNLEFPAPAIYERLAILYRKQKRKSDEIQILEQGLFLMKRENVTGATIPKLKERLKKLKQAP